VVLGGGFTAGLLWYLGGQEAAATKQAQKFMAALVKHRPSAAPPKGDDYVRGVWHAYRRVDSARLIKTHQNTHNDSNSNGGYTWWVADMLLHTGRGLVVLELAFEPNHLDPKEQVIDLLYELTPSRIPDGALDAATLARVRSDQRERGAKPENDITLSVDAPFGSSGRSSPRPGRPAAPAPGLHFRTPPIIKCIRRARRDVTKIQRCAHLANT
jgi:hypothetical protein